MNGNFPPSPFDPLPQLNLYTDGTLDNYWYDDRDFDMQAYQTQSAAVAANRSARGAYSTGGGISSSGQSMPPGALWLQITGISNSIVSLNLNGATDTVYEVWSKTDLEQTNWNIETEVFPTNQQVMPCTINEDGRGNLTIWARDWMGITSGGNETPEWWFYKFYKTVNLSDTNLDAQGRTLCYDYQHGIDPRLINEVWMQITGITNNVISLALNNATDMVYEVWSATSLSNPVSWNIERAVWADTNQIATPFIVEMLDRTNGLFFWARDWIDVTSNGNLITPEWWFWEYFGTVDMSENARDAQGLPLWYDYQMGINPSTNFIAFALNVTNPDFNTSNATVQITVLGGAPYYMAVLVDSSDSSTANWTPFNSNLVVNLGRVVGWHTVSVGLKGFPQAAQQAWGQIQLKLVLTPPVLVVTNPIVGTVTQPFIQLQGYCSENLATMSYDLSNSASFQTNQQAFVTTRQFETNYCEYTTNGFQCFNIPLADGANTITLHATDSAGNVTVTNLVYVLDPAANTNPPVINLSWPQNNAAITGTNFPVRGVVNDPFATVGAQIVNAGGTSTLTGLVEQNGSFWIENMPLGSGTNYLTVTATNTAGYGSITNIVVVQSLITLTIASVSFNDPTSPTATVNGTLSGSSDNVLVNGVQATHNDGGTWTAYYVPVGSSGSATITAEAVPSGAPAAGSDGGSIAADAAAGGADAQTGEDVIRSSGILLVDCNWNEYYQSYYDGRCPHVCIGSDNVVAPLHYSYGSTGYNLWDECSWLIEYGDGNDPVGWMGTNYTYDLITWDATGCGSDLISSTGVCGEIDGTTSSGYMDPTQYLPTYGEIANCQFGYPEPGGSFSEQYLDPMPYRNSGIDDAYRVLDSSFAASVFA
jgi:hypothetical protein